MLVKEATGIYESDLNDLTGVLQTPNNSVIDIHEWSFCNT